MIASFEEYDYCVSRGYEPLLDARLPMEHVFRSEVQKALFGKNKMRDNAKFYKWCLAKMPHICEECGKPIEKAWSGNVSHILTRGAYPEMAHDPRNVNILCLNCHRRWENGDRRNMRIWERNERTIKALKEEYK